MDETQNQDVTGKNQGSIAYVYLLTLIAALGGMLFGYDTGVINGAIGFLQKHFDLDPSFEKGWVTASALIGCSLGVALAGFLIALICFFICFLRLKAGASWVQRSF